jgi:hypothetical protein
MSMRRMRALWTAADQPLGFFNSPPWHKATVHLA